MKRIWLKPTSVLGSLEQVLCYYSGSGTALIEPAVVTEKIMALHDVNVILPQFKHEFSKESPVIACQLEPRTVVEILSLTTSEPATIGAIHIFEEDKLMFLSGDQLDQECMSFLPIDRNAAIVHQLIRDGKAVVIFGTEEDDPGKA